MPQSTEADTIRILVATDNHVGFEERDPIRKDDSWKTFDEVIRLANTHDVDMVLLAGDLFHDNKPSRKSMYQVMRTLRKNCLGMKPCELEFLSDASEIFEGAFSHVNYEDPDINISIPVFSIHGNHDDPSGDGHFCSLDLLQVAGLVNYFGRVPEADNVKVKPILLQKGRTKLALYGISNVRDERMHRTFRDHKVTFFRPNQQPTDFFNLLALHQNHYAHTATSYLPENFLPDWLDLVVWGHEHECLIDPQQNPETGFHVMQPGSSVATSMVPGEAVQKHVALLSVTGREFKVDKIPLKTVRPFVTQEITLATDKRFKELAKKKDNKSELTQRLRRVVDEMIEQAREEWQSIQDEADDHDDDEEPLPLIRLKVEYTAPEGGIFQCENPQRFSNHFIGRVANSNDVVYFYRKKTGVSRRAREGGEVPDRLDENMSQLDTIQVQALVEEYLAAQSLQVLPHGEFGDAVNQFVNKDDKHAMDSFVSESLATQLKEILALDPGKDVSEAMSWWREEREKKFKAGIASAMRKRKYKPKPDDWDSDMDGHWENQPQAFEYTEPESIPEPASNKQTRNSGRASARVPSDDDDDDMMDNFEDTPQPKAPAKSKAAAKGAKAAPAKKAPTKPGRGRKRGGFVVSDDDDPMEEDMFVDEDDEPPAPPPKRAPARGSNRTQPARTSGRTKQTTLSFAGSQKPTRGTQKTLEISDDEISEDDAFESMPATRSRRR